jgi:hypothetical protein
LSISLFVYLSLSLSDFPFSRGCDAHVAVSMKTNDKLGLLVDVLSTQY